MIAAANTMPVVGEGAFLGWLESAAPGERIAYHEGHLVCDRTFGVSQLPDPVREEVNRVALRARNLAEEGTVLLAQRRAAGDRVVYLAIKARDSKATGGRA